MFSRISHPLDKDEQELLREVLGKLHPDHFQQFPSELQKNNEQLKVLNKYVDELQTMGAPKPVKLDFSLIEGGQIKPVHVDLSRGGDLYPLFLAFGLIEPTSKAGKDLKKGDAGFWNSLKLEFERHFDKQGFRL
ncbi:hypothetical protein DUNSADRAFT_2492 [Dunaliella salina]|uniref:DUF4460 domain-containing protein n=1 Tax=Dunaliella salina TaxID=3046 RepID=A0ABQ7FWD4_DUNSA|nr:hypothetical protein DUNSADRAFT_2492 [Dunaliella salina]|eukprot:KAF5826631.1 hypothetical protein DUNSADRAFT_2492 [Dunaliella salina]